MKAYEAIDLYGRDLIGRRVFTSSRSDYRGGWSTVTRLGDFTEPEIAFHVRHPNVGETVVYCGEHVQVQIP